MITGSVLPAGQFEPLTVISTIAAHVIHLSNSQALYMREAVAAMLPEPKTVKHQIGPLVADLLSETTGGPLETESIKMNAVFIKKKTYVPIPKNPFLKQISYLPRKKRTHKSNRMDVVPVNVQEKRLKNK